MHSLKLLLPMLVLTAMVCVEAFAKNTASSMDEILAHYQKIQQSLAADSLAGVKTEAQAIAQKAEALGKETGPAGKNPAEFKKILGEIRERAQKLNTDEIKKARDAFAELSQPLIRYITDFPTGPGKYYIVQCPMAKRSWVQTEKKITNPYFGKSMLGCGTIVSK